MGTALLGAGLAACAGPPAEEGASTEHGPPMPTAEEMTEGAVTSGPSVIAEPDSAAPPTGR